MVIINFSHPLTEEQLAQIEALAGQKVERVMEIPTQLDPAVPFAPQVAELADKVGFSPREWQTSPILINPPSLNFIAVALLAELHGRMGYFPTIIRLRPVANATPPRFEVAELINLQAVRDWAREQRK
jgi:hypothetical protein